MIGFLCDCCDLYIEGHPYLAQTETGPMHRICFDCAADYAWCYLEAPDGKIIIDSEYPTYWERS